MISIPCTYDFQPGNGTRYEITLVDDPHGGVLVVWPTQATYRWFPRYGELRHLHGNLNLFDMDAIQTYLNGVATAAGVLQ
tara:strand:+ start:191 stop:430 length:240 start_codon:yes stop_codon:yes gene_type:complete